MNCFAKRKIASVYGLTFSSFDDRYFQHSLLKQSTNAKQPKKQGYPISNRSHHPVSLSLSLSLFHWPKHTSTIVMVVFFSYSTQRQFYSVYFLSRFCCLFRHILSNISLSLSLTFFLSLSFSSTLAHIIIMFLLLQ